MDGTGTGLASEISCTAERGEVEQSGEDDLNSPREASGNTVADEASEQGDSSKSCGSTVDLGEETTETRESKLGSLISGESRRLAKSRSQPRKSCA